MAAADPAVPRYQTLDVVRGVAVMGILAMNVVGFGLPVQAYLNPAALGPPTTADLVSWALSFVLIEGKMRGLFSFLFGASMLLVVERAQAAGLSATAVHYSRMAWLLGFGLVHYYLIWSGDILTGYALVGMVAYLFRNKAPEHLIGWGCALLLVQCILIGLLSESIVLLSQAAAAPGASADVARQWQQVERDFGVVSGPQLDKILALYRGTYSGIVHHRLTEQATKPFNGLYLFGWETLGYMLFGMAALKSGFITGTWSNRAYLWTALIGYGVGVPAYAGLAWAYAASDFSTAMTFTLMMAATVPFRPPMFLATAAVIILLTREHGRLSERIAAAGRAAFTNYLGTSLLMTALFYGYGFALFGAFGRAQLWLVVLVMWLLMLAWSKPWLDRFQYGPLEWLWRTLARWRLQPLRRPMPA